MWFQKLPAFSSKYRPSEPLIIYNQLNFFFIKIFNKRSWPISLLLKPLVSISIHSIRVVQFAWVLRTPLRSLWLFSGLIVGPFMYCTNKLCVLELMMYNMWLWSLNFYPLSLSFSRTSEKIKKIWICAMATHATAIISNEIAIQTTLWSGSSSNSS